MKFVSRVWDYDISATQKLVLMKLGDNANDEGFCWPSIPNIARKCSLTDRTVQRVLTFLEKNGCVIRRIRHGRSTYFTITDPSQWRLPLLMVTQSHPARKSPRGDTESPLGVTQSHPETTIGNRQETKTVIVSVNHGDKLKPIEHFLSDEDYDHLREAAPGWDKYELFILYDNWCSGKEPPRNRRAAFFGWVKKFTKSKPPNGTLFAQGNSYG